MRGLMVTSCAAALVMAGMTGCSTKKSESAGASGAVSASAGAGTAKVSIDGKPKRVNGEVVCSNMGGNFTIAIGEQATGIAVVKAEDASKVDSVGLGNVDGVVLGYQAGAPGGNASATKTGKTYTVSGTATGADMANPMQPLTKPFEIEVTCP